MRKETIAWSQKKHWQHCPGAFLDEEPVFDSLIVVARYGG